MKKKLLVIASAFLLASGVYAMELMELMEDEELSKINAQAGLTVQQYINDMRVSFSIEGLSWGDDDGCSTAGLAGLGAGHFALRGATIAGAQSQTIFTMQIPSTGAIRYDVDANGIYLTLPSFNISIVSAPRIQVSVSANTVNTFTGVLQTDTTKVLGDLALDNVLFTVTMPGIFRYSAH